VCPKNTGTDSLSAAFYQFAEQEELTRRYADLVATTACAHHRCNPAVPTERLHRIAQQHRCAGTFCVVKSVLQASPDYKVLPGALTARRKINSVR
jgi:hypothetical protein